MLLLLVDYNQSKVFKRSKYGTSCAYNYPDIFISDSFPFVKTLSCRESTVKNGNLSAVTAHKKIKSLRRKSNFGHHNDNIFTFIEHFVNKPQVNHRLTAARNSV